MKIYRYDNSGRAALGVEHNDRLYNLEQLFQNAGQRPPDVLSRGDLRAVCAAPEGILEFVRQYIDDLDEQSAAQVTSVPLESAQVLAPIPDPSKIICIGLNYLDHCEEQNKPRPQRPMLFAKFANAIAGPTADVPVPPNTQELDFEGELAVVISRRARNVSRSEALRHVFGYMVLLDVSARDLQRTDGQWVRAKSQDNFAPCGPCIVTADEIPDPQNIGIRTVVNGQIMQDSNTSNMIFPIDELIAFISESVTLEPGDIISTGTPAGVGVHRNPPVLLRPGDTVEVTLEKIGTLKNRFV